MRQAQRARQGLRALPAPPSTGPTGPAASTGPTARSGPSGPAASSGSGARAGPSGHSAASGSAGPSGGAAAEEEAELREAWRQRSHAAGWTAADDWQSPAVDAVIAAMRTGAGLPEALRMLGESRGAAGAGIAETLTDLGALLELTGRTRDPLALAKPVAEGWAEAGLVTVNHSTCEDPLTGLVTMPYLRTRLGEVYREALRDGTYPPDTHRLLVITFTASLNPWQRMTRALVIGNDLRSAFPGGETLSLAGRSRLIVLARARRGPSPVTAGLRHILADTHGARVRVYRLPSGHEEALRLLGRLAAR